MKVRLSSAAYRDLLDGSRFYERQVSGLGIYFLDSLYDDIESLKDHAGVHPKYFSKYHRLLSKKFPFAIYYTVYSRDVHIHAVLDCRRNPAWTRKKLDD